MANNPIDTKSFQHFLEIRGVENKIAEPNNFILANFKAVRDDVAVDTYFGNEQSQLEFNISFGKPCTPFMDNNGVLISYLPSGAELLIEENKNHGSESDVKYILKKDGVEFTTGNFDFTTAETDNITYFKCKVIQNTNQSKIKKREKLNINLLSTQDLDDNVISQIPIQRILLKAKPLYQASKWKKYSKVAQNYDHFGQDGYLFPLSASNLTNYGLENSFAQFDEYYEPSLATADEIRVIRSGARMVIAKEDLSNITISINNLNAHLEASPNVDCRLSILYGAGYFSSEATVVDLQTGTGGLVLNNFNYQLTIPNLQSGHHIMIYFGSFVGNFPTGAILGDVTLNASVESIDITATSTAIDSVINAVRWIDLIKQNYKAIGSLPVDAPKYDVGGEFYDNFCFNKNLIKQDTVKPFNVKLTDTIDSLQELNSYAQINENEIYIGQYEDFYQNIDMGGFLEIPTYESEFIKNERYLVNQFTFGYEKYEQDRAERNTIDAIHTNSEWFPQTQNSINQKEIKLPFIRDPFSIETARKTVFSVNDNSDNTDDNVFIIDVTQLAPNTRRKFIRRLTVVDNGANGTTKIKNDNTFTWDKLGFNVGDIIKRNGVNRTVIGITPNILTLSFSGSSSSLNSFNTIDYPITNVLYTNRTSEGLISSSNLRNSENFSNLRYSIKRNMRHWFAVLATYGKFIPTKKIKNTYFKSNGECITQFTGEPNPIKENEDILISDITDKKILTQDIYKTSVKSSFYKAVQLLNDIQNVRGFIRVQNPSGGIIKGYVKIGDNIWVNEELVLELEVKNESDFLNVNFASGIFTINEVGYSTKTASEKRYNIFNDFIQFFDENSINLCNRTKFDKVSLNGVTYDNIDNLVNALENL